MPVGPAIRRLPAHRRASPIHASHAVLATLVLLLGARGAPAREASPRPGPPRPLPPAGAAAIPLPAADTLPTADALPGPEVPGNPDGLRDPDGHPFRAPAASPAEPLLRLAIVRASRDTSARTVALPDLGAELPLRLARDPAGAWELSGSLAGGVFSRFDLERSDNELVEVHYRVGLRLRGRWRGVAARAALRHVSSHLGDEYLVRTGRPPVSTSREEVELLVQIAPLRGILVYGGPAFVIRSSEGLERPSLSAGAEWRASRTGARVSPYAAMDVWSWAELGWEPRVAAEAGIEIGARARLAVTAGAGPSRAEQFFREDETVVGVLFSFRR